MSQQQSVGLIGVGLMGEAYARRLVAAGYAVLGDFAPEGRVRQTLKDTQLMLDQARKVGQKLPLLEIHAHMLAACMRHGEADADNAIVIEEIRRRVL